MSSDLTVIEQYLGQPLPQRYREVMLAYPLDPTDSNVRRALCNDVEFLLALNGELREGEFADEWRPDWFVIGCSPCGDSYFLELAGGSVAVFQWDHETHEVTQEAADLDEFVAQWAIISASSKTTPKLASPWWRFWQ